MAELTPQEAEAIAHWSTFGRPGAPRTTRYVPVSEKLHGFVTPASGDWPDVFDEAQTQVLLNGFEPREMEDKWLIYSDDVSDAGTTAVHFHRSWTGSEIVRVNLQLTPTGSTLTRATWEMDAEVLKFPGEAFARSSFLECCRWVLGMPVSPGH